VLSVFCVGYQFGYRPSLASIALTTGMCHFCDSHAVFGSAEGGSRTHTRLPSSVFETDASAIPPLRHAFSQGQVYAFALVVAIT
jgi:hypothetical protein